MNGPSVQPDHAAPAEPEEGPTPARSPRPGGPLARLARLAHRRARLLLVLSVVALVAAAALGVGAFGKLQNGGFDDPASPSSRAAQLLDSRFGGTTDLVLLVRASGGGSIDTPADAAAGRALTADLRAEPGLTHLASYWDSGAATATTSALRGDDGAEALIVAHVDGTEQQASKTAKALISRYTGDHDGLTVQAGGRRGVNNDVSGQVTKDLALAEGIAVPVTLLLLVLAFGSLVAALLPLVIGVIAILGTFAELDLLGSVTSVSVFAINLTTALGLGLGIDYALLLVSRFREELAAGRETSEALVATVRTAGRTILFSAATVATALAALLLFPPFFLRSFAYAGIGVVAIAALAALIVVPALLAVLGPRVNAGRLPWPRSTPGAASPRWGRLAAAVMRRPARWALPVLAVLLLGAAPLLGVGFGTPDQRVLPTSAPSRQVADALAAHFPGNDTTALQVVTDGPVDAAHLDAYALTLSRLPGVGSVTSSAGIFHDGVPLTGRAAPAGYGTPTAQRLTLATTDDPHSSAAQNLVDAVRAVPAPAAGVRAYVGGDAAVLVDAKHTIGSRLPYAVGLVAATTFLLLFLFTGSVLQPLRALLLNAISLSAALGAMVWIFQDGHLAGLLGFTAQPMDTSMTVLMFCVAFGLSMDYEVFVTSRIKEMHDAGAGPGEAVTEGLSRTGRIVSTAAGLLAVSFFAFGTSSISFLQMFGIGTGLAILLDAVLVRGVLVPAVLRLLGDTAWYAPGPLRRLHNRIGLAEAADGPGDSLSSDDVKRLDAQTPVA
ncbi:RND superfamily putative drug exporter [Streptomyces sp. 846.5]|nr:MMPL family transporter [Streptomyces sp. 846.5]TDU02639.1 RND superfamily putative drug exporter [Streptomyces sp. 846.5]